MNWYKFKYFCQLYSLVACIFFTSLMFCEWYMAFFGGYQAVLVTINEWNEMWLEFYAWFLVIPLVMYGFYLNLIEVFYGKDKD